MALGAPQSSSLSRKTAFLFLVASFFPFSSFAISPLPPGRDTLVSPATNPAGAYDPDSSGVSTDYSSKNPNGTWSLVTISSGVSGIHWAITPLVNTLVLIDRSDRDNSYVKDVNGNMASASVLDLANVTAGPRGLDVLDNTFCSAGQFWPNGTLINTGGFQTTNGNTAAFSGVRHLDPCPGNGSCDFYEYPGVNLLAKRWYPSAHLMPDGVRIVVIGGAPVGDLVLMQFTNQTSPTYEILPRTAPADAKLRTLPVLVRAYPAPLYPFLHLMPNGYFFVMANYYAVLYNFDTGDEIKLPDMPGNITRSYPYTGTSVLLPMSLENNYTAEILVCGGTKFNPNPGRDLPADDSCGRIRPLDPNPEWVMETMPDARIVPDAIITANGQIMIINGGRKGRAGLNAGPSNIHDPVYEPALYHPGAPPDARWTNLAPENIARLYHSLAILDPDSCILTGGSSPYDCCVGCGPQCFGVNCTGADDSCYPNEFTINKFCPPYVSSGIPQPRVAAAPATIGYGATFVLTLTIRTNLTVPAVRAAIMNPGFGTHSQHMGQRFIWLELDYATLNYTSATGGVTVAARGPPGNTIAPPGYYYLFCHDSNIPSKATWVQVM